MRALLPLLVLSAVCSSGVTRAVRAEVPPRLILIKVDGLSPLVLDAAVDPADPSTDRLPHPELLRDAHSQLRSVLKRDSLVPNIEAYFYRRGVRTPMYCATLPLFPPST